jgi:hypothetical protein
MIINVRECITARHLLERIVASMLDTLDELDTDGPKLDRRPYARTENFAALSVHLSRLLEGREKFVLVLDAMDRLRESSSMGTLIAALGRLGEFVPSLCVVLVTTLPLAPGVLHAASVPRINFPPYTVKRAISGLHGRPRGGGRCVAVGAVYFSSVRQSDQAHGARCRVVPKHGASAVAGVCDARRDGSVWNARLLAADG